MALFNLVAQGQTSNVTIVAVEGSVQVMRSTNTAWIPALNTPPDRSLLPGDRVRTLERSRTAIQLSDLTIKQVGPNSHIQVLPSPPQQSSFRLFQGIFSFFHRDQPAQIRIQTPVVAMTIRGTEFQVKVNAADGSTEVQVFEGQVQLTNEFGSLILERREAGVTRPNEGPRRAPVLDMHAAVQWALYYPGVLHVHDLELPPQESTALEASVSAYQRGALLDALQKLPPLPPDASTSFRTYTAATLLSVGDVEQASALLNTIPKIAQTRAEIRALRIATALKHWIQIISNNTSTEAFLPETATEWMMESYRRQWARSRSKSRHSEHLQSALEAANSALQLAPQFGFAWQRIGELHFASGQTLAAENALNHAMIWSPFNAQAWSLQGFIWAARRDRRNALEAFERALQLDPHLGNAWLGRGLCRIGLNDPKGGRIDLEIAAALEPRRSLLRSYLAKAWNLERDNNKAMSELELAKDLDPNDPTPWLYQALLSEQGFEYNRAIHQLGESLERNDARRVYRSEFLLDQDRAVRSGNLARIYKEAGLPDVSLTEASHAIVTDYASAEAHLNLADSYEALRSRNRIDLRYETPAYRAFLLSRLLAPVGIGSLSPSVSLQEYTNLMEQDRVGFASSSVFESQGRWFHKASQFGTLGNTSYSVDGSFESDPGFRPNQDLLERSLSLRLKQALTPQDSLYLDATLTSITSGDRTEYENPIQSNPVYRTRETQDPILALGYHREWSPGHHTLLLATRLGDRQHADNPLSPITLIQKDATGNVIDAIPITMEQIYRNRFSGYGAELQQIAALPTHTLVFGARFQDLSLRINNEQRNPPNFLFLLFPPNDPPINQEASLNAQRKSIYAYDSMQCGERVTLIGGLSYDILDLPENHRFAPVSSSVLSRHRVSPKSGILWHLHPNSVLRAAYTRSLGGVSFDQSFQIEPFQVAGFDQAFRSVIPESLTGANSAEQFESASMAWDRQWNRKTFLQVQAQWLSASVDRTRGTMDLLNSGPPLITSGISERLRFTEPSIRLFLHHLMGNHWSSGIHYRVAHSRLSDSFPSIPDNLVSNLIGQTRSTSLFHEIQSHLHWNHPSGLFAKAEAIGILQKSVGEPHLIFGQGNVWMGYRFPRRHAELRAGILNITDRSSHRNPINSSSWLPEERVFTLGLNVLL